LRHADSWLVGLKASATAILPGWLVLPLQTVRASDFSRMPTNSLFLFCRLAWGSACLQQLLNLVRFKQLYARSVGGDLLAALKIASADPNVSRF
jgi:hypothetical protein